MFGIKIFLSVKNYMQMDENYMDRRGVNINSAAAFVTCSLLVWLWTLGLEKWKR